MQPLPRGETRSYTFDVDNPDGTPMQFAGKKLVATLRLRDVVQFTKRNLAAGGSDAEIETPADGVLKLKFASADTINMDPCLLDGDLWVYTDASDPIRLQVFKLQVAQSQTRAFP
jgi:hypothetical protein